MVQQERNYIWAMIKGAQERNDWRTIQCDSEGEIILGSPIVSKAAQMPHGKEIPLMMPWEDVGAGPPPSPKTICVALADNDNISERPVPSVLTCNMGEEQPQDQTEATVLHYHDDSVVIIHGNGQETILTSWPWNGDRDPMWIYTWMTRGAWRTPWCSIWAAEEVQILSQDR